MNQVKAATAHRSRYYLAVPFLLPWPRVVLLVRRILATQWDAETWPAAKAELRRALELRRRLARAGWWN